MSFSKTYVEKIELIQAATEQLIASVLADIADAYRDAGTKRLAMLTPERKA
jgi:hypothetical protein